MKRILIGVITVICSLSATSLSQEKRGREVPCGETGTQAEANACARLEYQKADAEMNKVYGRLMAELAGYKGNDQQKLQRAQALWLQYRDANCESEASIYQGGSIRPAVYNSCLASVTRERARRLTEFLAVTTQ
jgi:uncharacterized protein YecT (DUF1311 family)